MKVVQINATCGRGSTGKICVSISKLLSERKTENYILYCSGDSNYPLGIKCADNNYIRLQSLKARMFGNWGFNSKKATRKMIAELERIKPDIVHLHNIHGHDCHLEMLFSYIKEKNFKVIWTFHDCWAFTGYCMYFDMVGCEQWKSKCINCPQKSSYSLFFDRSSYLFKLKNQLFNDLPLSVVSPSVWLTNLAKQSFLSGCDFYTIPNGIDCAVFYPRHSDFRKRYGLASEYIVLGVASEWERRKGLDVFVRLSEKLGQAYKIVLVGTSDAIEKQLPNNIIPIQKTHNQIELAEIYSIANIFVNPTREDNYPTVNMEAIACGTPVVTFRTGGSPEMIDETCGSIVAVDDIDAMEAEIKRICETTPYSMEACMAKAKSFDMNDRFLEYIELYKEIYDRPAK